MAVDVVMTIVDCRSRTEGGKEGGRRMMGGRGEEKMAGRQDTVGRYLAGRQDQREGIWREGVSREDSLAGRKIRNEAAAEMGWREKILQHGAGWIRNPQHYLCTTLDIYS